MIECMNMNFGLYANHEVTFSSLYYLRKLKKVKRNKIALGKFTFKIKPGVTQNSLTRRVKLF